VRTELFFTAFVLTKSPYSSDEVMKSMSYLTEAVMDPVSGHSDDIFDLAFNRAFNRKDGLWTFYEEPGNEYRLSRFAATMNASKNMAPPNAVAEGKLFESHC
jgi:hypothetical protein